MGYGAEGIPLDESGKIVHAGHYDKGCNVVRCCRGPLVKATEDDCLGECLGECRCSIPGLDDDWPLPAQHNLLVLFAVSRWIDIKGG